MWTVFLRLSPVSLYIVFSDALIALSILVVFSLLLLPYSLLPQKLDICWSFFLECFSLGSLLDNTTHPSDLNFQVSFFRRSLFLPPWPSNMDSELYHRGRDFVCFVHHSVPQCLVQCLAQGGDIPSRGQSLVLKGIKKILDIIVIWDAPKGHSTKKVNSITVVLHFHEGVVIKKKKNLLRRLLKGWNWKKKKKRLETPKVGYQTYSLKEWIIETRFMIVSNNFCPAHHFLQLFQAYMPLLSNGFWVFLRVFQILLSVSFFNVWSLAITYSY